MSTLYEIDRAILETIDTETGEILDFEKLDELQVEREKKIENIALYIKNLLSQSKEIREEEKALAERRKGKETRAEYFKKYLEYSLCGNEFETPKTAITYRKSSSLEVQDTDKLQEYLEKMELDFCLKYSAPEIKKTELTKLVKEGNEIPYCELVTKNNIQIK